MAQRNTLTRSHLNEAMQRTPAKRRGGFTLIELMAATGIMVAIILLVLSLTTSVLNSWNASSAQLAQNFEARVAMDLLAKDLQTMRLRSNGMAWLEVRQEAVPSGPAGTQDFSQLYFFSPVLDRPDTPGDLCAVMYQVRYKNPFTDSITDNPQYGLYRAVVDAENTFNYGLTLGNYDQTVATSPYGLWTGGGLPATSQTGAAVPAASLATWSVSGENYLSANVVEFDVKFFYEATTATGAKVIREMLPDDFVYTSRPDSDPTNLGADTFSRLSYAEIRMVVLGDEGAQIVAADAIPTTLSWDQFKSTYGKVFTRRVYIFANPI